MGLGPHASKAMLCDEVFDVVEAIAAGEVAPDGRVSAHLASCPKCAGALKDAQEIEHLLVTREVPAPPPQFTARTLARVRRARWRSEQFVDATFNFAMAVIVVAVVAGVWLVTNRSGLVSVSNDAVDLLGTGVMTLARRVAPSLPLYAAATALLASALGIWWWAERGASLS